MEKQAGWPDSDKMYSPEIRSRLETAFSFLAAVRCFLHFRQKRDHNVLTWDAQEEAVAQRLGLAEASANSAVEWMRVYFGHARAIDRISSQLLEEMPAAQSNVLQTAGDMANRIFERRLFGRGRADLHSTSRNVERTAAFSDLSPDCAARLQTQPDGRTPVSAGDTAARRTSAEWSRVLAFFAGNIAGIACAGRVRAMHSLHLLTLFLPELRGIDGLAVRDFSHRFTVDEHTLQAIENLHILRQSKSKWEQRYADILGKLEQPELLVLAILLHDTGKSAAGDDHIQASLAIARTCLKRLELSAIDAETVLFLIKHHLDMSETLRRDIYDPGTIAQFSDHVGTPDRLKMLCLFTYADIKAVNPEALSAWKAEDLWQLYIGTANYLDRSVDERVHADANDEVLNHLRSLAPAAGKKLPAFLEGLPRRYLRTHPVDEILQHFEMANRLGQDPVQLALKRSRHWYELTVVTMDRPFLFATVAGALVGLRHEHWQSRRLFQPKWNGRRYIQLHR